MTHAFSCYRCLHVKKSAKEQKKADDGDVKMEVVNPAKRHNSRREKGDSVDSTLQSHLKKNRSAKSVAMTAGIQQSTRTSG